MRITSTHHTREGWLAVLIGLCVCQLTAPAGAAVTERLKYPNHIHKQGVLETFGDGAEVINTKGQATVSFKPKEIVVAGWKSAVSAPPQAPTELPVIVYTSRSLIGLTYGQTLRVNALYPDNPADPNRERVRDVRARLSLYDSNAALLAQSAEATILRGEFHSFDFDRAGIPAPGEAVSGRLQVRVSLEVAVTNPFPVSQDPSTTGPLVASLELFATDTGRTTAVWVTVGFFEVVPPRRP
jgi:hypothetical protein